MTEEEVENLSYFDRCKLLNTNPVLLARHFQYRVECFCKEIVLNGPLGKVKYYIIRVEFQYRGSPHVHCLIWVENMPVLTEDSIDDYVEFVDSIISANIPEEECELKQLVKKYQIHHHSKTCKKYHARECRFNFGQFFSKKNNNC